MKGLPVLTLDSCCDDFGPAFPPCCRRLQWEMILIKSAGVQSLKESARAVTGNSVTCLHSIRYMGKL